MSPDRTKRNKKTSVRTNSSINMGSDKLAIEYFDGTNYQSWKQSATFLLLSKGLFEATKYGPDDEYIVENEELTVQEKSGEGLDADKTKTKTIKKVWKNSEGYKSKSSKAYGYICASLMPEYRIHILDIDNAHDAWKKLEETFGDDDERNKSRLMSELLKMKHEHDESLDQYYARTKFIHTRLTNISVVFPVELYEMKFFEGLRGKLADMRQIVQYMPNMNFKDKLALLRQEEHTLNERHDGHKRQALNTSKYRESNGCGCI